MAIGGSRRNSGGGAGGDHKRVARLLREDNLLAVQSPVGL